MNMQQKDFGTGMKTQNFRQWRPMLTTNFKLTEQNVKVNYTIGEVLRSGIRIQAINYKKT